MKPTVGRIVHYHHPKLDAVIGRAGPFAALVTAVGTERLVLTVFLPGRLPDYTDVPASAGALGLDGGYWNWPPREA